MNRDDSRVVLLAIVIVVLCCLSAYLWCLVERHNPEDDDLVLDTETVVASEAVDSFTMPDGYGVASIDVDFRGSAVEVVMWHKGLGEHSFVSMAFDNVLQELAAPLRAEVEARFLGGGGE